MKYPSLVFGALWLPLLLVDFAWAQTTEVPANEQSQTLQMTDIFDIEFATDPQISPDGKTIVYVRNQFDIMKDRRRTDLWTIDSRGRHLPLFSGKHNYSSPRWSPSGDRLAFVSDENDQNQIFCYWMESGRKAQLTNLNQSPGSLTWSRNGKSLCFSMSVPAEPETFAPMPAKPKGAEWAEPPTVITRLNYRRDGAGYLPQAHTHLFVLSAEGGTPRQLTHGDYDHGGPYGWAKKDSVIIFSANRHPNHEYDPTNSEIYSIAVADRKITALTDRQGPDTHPVVSPGGEQIAYLGHDENYLGYQQNHLYVMGIDGKKPKPCLWIDDLDRSISSPQWIHANQLIFKFDDMGVTKLASTGRAGNYKVIAENVGGTSLGRPYGGGSYSVSMADHSIAFTQTSTDRPADVAAIGSSFKQDGAPLRLTDLNADLLSFKQVGRTEEIRFPSRHDDIELQGWIIYPPGYDKNRSYPLILEIHGGPFANYGPRFTPELQLMAAAGYVVFYMNPRGSTSYGADFANLIHHNYPGNDYDDLMSGVDAVIERANIDRDNLFVTGGSGGGVLTSWIVGKTDRFRAAVVCKPVINWYSFALTADMYNYFYKYWFPGLPWEEPEQYMKRSPISLVGNVKTPTMLLTGTEDYRTPMSETEQFYQALKLQKVDTAMVRIPGASHSIAARPSQLIAKVVHVLKWFEKHRHSEPSAQESPQDAK
ncbi:MAG: S9 family peptidase [Mariniblastus sp.]|nr:S9 family peptidase [Mariniblastus sp.]